MRRKFEGSEACLWQPINQKENVNFKVLNYPLYFYFRVIL